MLHLEIIQERLSREFNQEVITTVPNVSYIAETTKGEILKINTPNDLPEPNYLEYVEEPYIRAQIITKPDYIGTIIKLGMEKEVLLSNSTISRQSEWNLHLICHWLKLFLTFMTV